jgi:hypothetical protein
MGVVTLREAVASHYTSWDSSSAVDLVSSRSSALVQPDQESQREGQADVFRAAGSARLCSAANRAMEMAVVGPDTRCQLDPNSAATTAGIIAA